MSLEKALPNYLSILGGKAKPKYLSARFEEKVATAYKMLESCTLCEHRCKVNRTVGERGFCRLGNEPKISSVFVHTGEEYFFVPSFTIFFTGCNFQCVFCQNYDISQLQEGSATSVQELTRLIDSAAARGCKNVNLVGGSPTPQLPWILDALSKANVELPIVWNSNFYMSTATTDLLNGCVDVYLSDWKYGNSKCALRLSKIKNYFTVVERNHKTAFEQAELVIRHLVLPNHFECCTKPIFEKISALFGEKAVVNVMDQYRPCHKANEYKDINRGLNREEFQQAIELAEELGLNFIQ